MLLSDSTNFKLTKSRFLQVFRLHLSLLAFRAALQAQVLSQSQSALSLLTLKPLKSAVFAEISPLNQGYANMLSSSRLSGGKSCLKALKTYIFNPMWSKSDAVSYPQRYNLFKTSFKHYSTMTRMNITKSNEVITSNLASLLNVKTENLSDLEFDLFNKLVDNIEYTNMVDENHNSNQSQLQSIKDDPSLVNNENRRDLVAAVSKEHKSKKLGLVREPLHIVDLGNIIRQCKLWKHTFPAITPYYAVKCNPNKVVLNTLFLGGVRTFDCASLEEFNLLQEVGIGNDVSIGYSHCIKPVPTLKYINKYNNTTDILSNIDYMTFDCREELDKIRSEAPDVPLYLRIQVCSELGRYGFDHKFGCLDSEMIPLIKHGLDNDLNIKGIMFHVGSSFKDSFIYNEALNKCRDLVNEVENTLGHRLEVIDIGGGFPGVTNHFGHEQPTFNEVSNVISTETESFDKDISFSAEPGRFFVTSSTTALFSVIGKRKRGEETHYFMNDSMYQTFSMFLYEPGYAQILAFNNLKNTGDKVMSTVFGRTCDGMDVIYKNTSMPKLEIGDLCIAEHFGAYGWNTHLPFNGFKNPNLIFVLSV